MISNKEFANLEKLMKMMQDHQITELNINGISLKHDTVANLQVSENTPVSQNQDQDQEETNINSYSIEEAHMALEAIGQSIHS